MTLVVRDLERTARLFCDALGADEVYDSVGNEHSLSREKSFLLGGIWIAVMQGDPPRERSYGHNPHSV